MNKQEQQIAIAGACGWSQTQITHTVSGRVVQYGFGPNQSSEWERPLPDYLNDLNAMHEAEKVLDQMQARTYADHLADSEQDGTWAGCHMWSQTAAQRAEAFLKTLNLWT